MRLFLLVRAPLGEAVLAGVGWEDGAGGVGCEGAVGCGNEGGCWGSGGLVEGALRFLCGCRERGGGW